MAAPMAAPARISSASRLPVAMAPTAPAAAPIPAPLAVLSRLVVYSLAVHEASREASNTVDSKRACFIEGPLFFAVGEGWKQVTAGGRRPARRRGPPAARRPPPPGPRRAPRPACEGS